MAVLARPAVEVRRPLDQELWWKTKQSETEDLLNHDQTKTNQISFAQDSRYLWRGQYQVPAGQAKKICGNVLCLQTHDHLKFYVISKDSTGGFLIQSAFQVSALGQHRRSRKPEDRVRNGSSMTVLIRRMAKVISEPWLCGYSPSTIWGGPITLWCMEVKGETDTVSKPNYKTTSSTARGGGGSFKNRKRIGEIDCCEWRMSEQKHWPTD